MDTNQPLATSPAATQRAILTESAEPDYGGRASEACDKSLTAARGWTRQTGQPSIVYAVHSAPCPTWGTRGVTYVALPADAAVPTPPDGGRLGSRFHVTLETLKALGLWPIWPAPVDALGQVRTDPRVRR